MSSKVWHANLTAFSSRQRERWEWIAASCAPLWHSGGFVWIKKGSCLQTLRGREADWWAHFHAHFELGSRATCTVVWKSKSPKLRVPWELIYSLIGSGGDLWLLVNWNPSGYTTEQRLDPIRNGTATRILAWVLQKASCVFLINLACPCSESIHAVGNVLKWLQVYLEPYNTGFYLQNCYLSRHLVKHAYVSGKKALTHSGISFWLVFSTEMIEQAPTFATELFGSL